MSADTPHDDDLHHLLGAFVLGGLSDDEQRDFTRHLRVCETCQRESAQFSGLPSLLDLLDPHDVEAVLAGRQGEVDAVGPTITPPALLAAVRARRRRGRWRLAAAAAVLVVAAGGVGVAVAPTVSRLGEPPTSRLVAKGPAGSRTSVDISLVSRGWGTQVDLSGSDLPTSGVLYLEVTDLAGRSWDVASWTGTPSGRTTLTTACWVKAADITMVQVHTRDGQTVAAAAL
ncbi:MAG: zf-HC2 domain-containing protein [Lapillicoccus sp.]